MSEFVIRCMPGIHFCTNYSKAVDVSLLCASCQLTVDQFRSSPEQICQHTQVSAFRFLTRGFRAV